MQFALGTTVVFFVFQQAGGNTETITVLTKCRNVVYF